METSETTVDQMRNVIMLITERNMLGNFTHIVSSEIREKAIEILKSINPPVDPDLLAAREIVQSNRDPKWPFVEFTEGDNDDTPVMVNCLAGIKFGRAHALSDLARLPDDWERAVAIFRERAGDVLPTEGMKDVITNAIAYGRAQLEPSHTVPPIEQDLIDAREICAVVAHDHRLSADIPQMYRDGVYDNCTSVPFVLQHLTSRRKP